MLPTTRDFTQWTCEVPALKRFVRKPAILLTFKGHPTQSNEEHQFTFSEMELPENATSILEWQMTSAKNPCDALEYRRWAKRNASYTSVYNFTSHYIGNEKLVIRFFVPITRVAFRTSRPIEAFCPLLSYFHSKSEFVNRFLSQDEPCRWYDWFNHILGNELQLKHGDIGSFDTDAFFLMDDALGMTFAGLHEGHPLLTRDIKKWQNMVTSHPALQWFIDQPWFAPQSVKEFSLSHFYPPSPLFGFTQDSKVGMC